MSPKLSELNDKMYQNKKLFSRIETIYKSEEYKNLDSEQQRLVWWYYTNFVREGAKLDERDKEKVGEINQELASLFTRFSQNLLAEEQNQFIELTTENDFDGLPDEIKMLLLLKLK